MNHTAAPTGPMRILMVSDVSPLQLSGGSARVIREQGRELVERGHHVSFLCRHPGDQSPLEGQVQGAPVLQYAVNRKSAPAYAWTSLLGARSLYLSRFKKDAWDAVLFHQPFSSIGVHAAKPVSQAFVYCFYSPSGVEYNLRAADPETQRRPAVTRIGAAVLTRLERLACQRSHRTVVLSEFSREVFRTYHSTIEPPIVVIPAGVDLRQFHPPKDRAAIRARLNIPQNVPVLLTVRDLEQRMGIDVLLAALKSLEDFRPFFCVIGGSGPLRPFLENRMSLLGLTDRVRFTGHIPESELPHYYQAADLFVLPTQAHEGFGLVTIESLACGTPVAATPVGATPEILEPLNATFLSADERAESLARTLHQAIPLAMEPAMRSRCRSYVEGRYSWRHHVEKIEAVIWSIRRERGNNQAKGPDPIVSK